MAEREQSPAAKSRTGEKPKHDVAATRTSGSKGEERQHGVREVREVGREVSDQSKERNTEIAVEAGHKEPAERRDRQR